MISERAKRVLDAIDADFERIKDEMLTRCGNENADIGDSGGAAELIASRLCPYYDEEREEFIVELASVSKLEAKDISYTLQEMYSWDDEDMRKAVMYEGFI